MHLCMQICAIMKINISDILPVSYCSTFSLTVFCLQHWVLHYHNPWFPSKKHHWLNESIIFARSRKDATKCNSLKGNETCDNILYIVMAFLPTVGNISLLNLYSCQVPLKPKTPWHNLNFILHTVPALAHWTCVLLIALADLSRPGWCGLVFSHGPKLNMSEPRQKVVQLRETLFHLLMNVPEGVPQGAPLHPSLGGVLLLPSCWGATSWRGGLPLHLNVPRSPALD